MHMKTLDQMTLDDLRAWRPEKIDFAVIREMADKIKDAVRPEKIILFGSYARKEQTDRSDVDLLVIADSSEPPPQRSVPIYRLLRHFLVPVDIMVRTPEEIKKYRNLPYSFIQTVLREGIVLYERKA